MMKFKTFVILLGVFSINVAHANLSMRLDLEEKMQEKVSGVVTSFDPHAAVTVAITLKKLDVVLPGASSQGVILESTATSSGISAQDIERIKVTISSKKSLFPKLFEQVIETSLGVPRGKVTIEFNENLLAFVKSPIQLLSDESQKFNNTFNEFEQKLYHFFYIGLGALGVLSGFLVLNAFGVFAFKRASRDQVKAIQDIGNEFKSRSKSAPQAAQAASGQEFQNSKLQNTADVHSPLRATGNDDESIAALSIDSLVSLISDCYWSRKDGYAAYLWTKMNIEQKKSLINNWNKAERYSEYLIEIEPRAENFHHHPYYFKASPLIHVSNEDLVGLIREDAGVWNVCSPIRKKEFHFSVVELIQLNSQQNNKKARYEFNGISEARNFNQSLDFGQISESDELSIFQNPNIIPESMRGQIMSIVWFALLPLETRKEMLLDWPASQLSEIWIGPDFLLEKLKESISEKKLPLVLEYQSKMIKNRRDQMMEQIVRDSLKNLTSDHKENHTSSNEIAKKAA